MANTKIGSSPYSLNYGTTVNKAGVDKVSKQTPYVDIYALRNKPGVVDKRKGGTQIVTADKKGSLLYKNEDRR